MKRLCIILTVSALAVVTGACQSKSAKTTGTTTAQEAAAVAQAQQLVQGCMTKGSVLTHDGRQLIENCIAPNGTGSKIVTCIQDHVGSVHSKATFESVAVNCVEANK